MMNNKNLDSRASDAVTDDMVERACTAFYSDLAWRTNSNQSRDFMRSALEAALTGKADGGEFLPQLPCAYCPPPGVNESERCDDCQFGKAAQPAATGIGDAVSGSLESHEAAKTYIRDWCPDHVKDYITSLEAQPAPVVDDRRVFIEGYMEAAHRHVHGSTPISAIEHHARLAADKAGYLAHPAQAGGEVES